MEPPRVRGIPAQATGLAILFVKAAALIAACGLMGCTVIGGMIGHTRDDEAARTRIVPREKIASVRTGAKVYLTIRNRETLIGRFAAFTSAQGRDSLALATAEGPRKISLDSIDEIVAEDAGHRFLVRDALIGAAVDALMIGSGAWLVYEINRHTTTIY